MSYHYLTSERIQSFLFEGNVEFFKILMHKFPEVFERILYLDAQNQLQNKDEKYVYLPNHLGYLIFERSSHRIMVRYVKPQDVNFSIKFREVLGEIFDEIETSPL